MNNDSESERNEALRQIGLITRLRVQGKLSSEDGRVHATQAVSKDFIKNESDDIAEPKVADPLTL